MNKISSFVDEQAIKLIGIITIQRKSGYLDETNASEQEKETLKNKTELNGIYVRCETRKEFLIYRTQIIKIKMQHFMKSS